MASSPLPQSDSDERTSLMSSIQGTSTASFPLLDEPRNRRSNHNPLWHDDEEQQQNTSPSGQMQLLRFNPTPEVTHLRIFDDRAGRSLKAIIKQPTLLITTGSSFSASISESRSVSGNNSDEWHFVLCNGIEGWARLGSNIHDEDSTARNRGQVFPVTRVRRYRRYEEWQGKNRFLCGGRVMLGSDADFFYFTNALYIAPSILFLAIVLPQSRHFVFSMVVVCLMCYTCFTACRSSLCLCFFTASQTCGSLQLLNPAYFAAIHPTLRCVCFIRQFRYRCLTAIRPLCRSLQRRRLRSYGSTAPHVISTDLLEQSTALHVITA